MSAACFAGATNRSSRAARLTLIHMSAMRLPASASTLRHRQNGSTSLYMASLNGSVEAVLLLLEGCADVEKARAVQPVPLCTHCLRIAADVC